MDRSADVIVIGGGIIGMSAAFQIARRSNARVLVLEKGRGPGEGSTGASSAVCRFRYSHPEIVQLARDGIQIYRNWTDFLSIAKPNARFQNIGVLWLSADPDWASREADRLTRLGIRAAALDDRDVVQAYPGLSTCVTPPDLVFGQEHDCSSGGKHLLEEDGGYMDPVDALQDLVGAARTSGVEVRFGIEVAEVSVDGNAVSGVRLAGGETLSCGAVVMAAGSWSLGFLDRLGLGGRWPLEPTRIQIVHLDRPTDLEGDLPVVVDLPGGIYFRPQNRGQQIILGSILEEDEKELVADPDNFARYNDDEFTYTKLHALQHRLRVGALSGHIRGYSGLYTINRADMHPVVGSTPIDGFHVAMGCSGHGFKLAPAIGALVARGVTGDSCDDDTGMDPSFLAFDREPIKLEAMNVLA